MRRLLLTSAFLAAMSLPSSAATLFIEAFDNGALVDSAQSDTGTLYLHVMDDPAFSIFAISAFGPPSLPGGDLLSVLDTVASSSISGTHTLEVDIFQSDLAWPARPITSTLNSYTFGLSVGPTTETAAINGGLGALGTPIESNTFAIGADATIGPLTTGAPALFATRPIRHKLLCAGRAGNFRDHHDYGARNVHLGDDAYGIRRPGLCRLSGITQNRRTRRIKKGGPNGPCEAANCIWLEPRSSLRGCETIQELSRALRPWIAPSLRSSR